LTAVISNKPPKARPSSANPTPPSQAHELFDPTTKHQRPLLPPPPDDAGRLRAGEALAVSRGVAIPSGRGAGRVRLQLTAPAKRSNRLTRVVPQDRHSWNKENGKTTAINAASVMHERASDPEEVDN
jgi:hypothetical protein